RPRWLRNAPLAADSAVAPVARVDHTHGHRGDGDLPGFCGPGATLPGHHRPGSGHDQVLVAARRDRPGRNHTVSCPVRGRSAERLRSGETMANEKMLRILVPFDSTFPWRSG